MKHLQMKLLVAASLMSVGSTAFAVDATEIIAEIGTYPAVIAGVGVAILGVVLATRSIGWIKSAIGR